MTTGLSGRGKLSQKPAFTHQLKTLLLLAAFWSACGVMASGQAAAPASSLLDLAQRQIGLYLAKLADLHCLETVTQEKLTGNGKVEATERAQFDYLIMMGGNGEGFQLNESRIESPNTPHKVLSMPMLVTNGVSSVLLVLHPYYRDSFELKPGPAETVDGKSMTPVHFTQIQGRRTPAALAVRGREYPLELQGTLWLDESSGDVMKVEAGLLRDMSDVGLRSLQIQVRYQAVNLKGSAKPMTLPALAVVEVTTARQHWRNTHVFEQYKTFTTYTEEDPSVKVRGAATGPDDVTPKENF